MADMRVRGPLFCGAARRGGPSDCRRPSGWGTDHAGWGRCKLHGGTTDSHRQAAQLAEAAATAQLFGVPREVHPIDGLLEEYWRSAGLVDAYEAMVMQLMPAEVTWGVVEEKRTEDPAGGGTGGDLAPVERKYSAGLNAMVKLFNEERDRFAKLGEVLLRLDLDSRKVELAQAHVAAMVTVLLSPDLALTDDQRRVAARMLRGMERAAVSEG